MVIADEVLYNSRGQETGAIRLSDGAEIWSWTAGKDAFVKGLAVGNDCLFVESHFERWGNYMLAALDRTTGASRWEINRRDSISPIVQENILYTKINDEDYGAIDPENQKVLWRIPYSPKIYPYDIQATHKFLLINEDHSTLVCISIHDGAPLWKLPGSLVAQNEEFSVIYRLKAVAIYETSTGQLVWEISLADEWSCSMASIIENQLTIYDNGFLKSFDLQTGLPIWEIHHATTPQISKSRHSVSLGKTIIVDHGFSQAFDHLGKEQWQTCALHGLTPMWANGKILLASNSQSIFALAPEKNTFIPSNSIERQILALRLISDYNQLSPFEKGYLHSLGEDTFQVLFQDIFEQDEEESGDEMSFYDKLETLEEVANASNTEQLLGVIKDRGSEDQLARTAISVLLNPKFSDARLPFFLQYVQTHINLGDGNCLVNSVVKALCGIGYESADSYLIELFKSLEPDNYELRRLYALLPRIGEAGAIEVIKLRNSLPIQLELWPEVHSVAKNDYQYCIEAIFEAYQRIYNKDIKQVRLPDDVQPFAMRGAKSICHAVHRSNQKEGAVLAIYDSPDYTFAEECPVGSVVKLVTSYLPSPYFLTEGSTTFSVRKFRAGWAVISIG